MRHSYLQSDVTFLFEETECKMLSVEEKEALIRSGVHYSQLLSLEKAPKPEYQALFEAQVAEFGPTFASHIVALAGMIAKTRSNPVIVSLARAGTPVGVLVSRILNKVGIPTAHYSLSIIRDRGLDLVALGKLIDQGHKPESIAFVDGWTGKGVMRRALSSTLAGASEKFAKVRDELYVVSDIAGVADYAATRNDILIPNCILNGTVSGLVSRTVTRDPLGSMQHGAVYLGHLVDHDSSLSFVNAIEQMAGEITKDAILDLGVKAILAGHNRRYVADEMEGTLKKLQRDLNIIDRNLIKPGIGEATRVLLRRDPTRLILRDPKLGAVRHLVELAADKNIPVEVMPELLIEAVAIINGGENE